jgi:hypothetical protein
LGDRACHPENSGRVAKMKIEKSNRKPACLGLQGAGFSNGSPFLLFDGHQGALFQTNRGFSASIGYQEGLPQKKPEFD